MIDAVNRFLPQRKWHLRLFSEVETEFCKSKSPCVLNAEREKLFQNSVQIAWNEVSAQNSFFNESLSHFLYTGYLGLT